MKLSLPTWLRAGRKSATYNALSSYEDLLAALGGRTLSKSGQAINWQTALRVSTVLACAREIANGIAQVPLKVYIDNEEQRDHPLWKVLGLRPNEWQTSYDYRFTIALHLVLAGNHYSFIERNVLGDIFNLVPLEPGRVCPKRADDWTLTYQVATPEGRLETLPASSIWHLRGPSWNSWHGMEAVQLAREAIGLALSTEEQHARLHTNGVHTSGVYSVDGTLDEKQYASLRSFLKQNFAGANAGLPMVLDRGAKWLSQAMSGVDSQHLETRRFQVEEVCRALNVLPIMVGHSDKATTYASAEAMFAAHVTKTLTPFYMQIEQSVGCHLISDEDLRRGVYAKFIAAGLLRGSMKDQAEYLVSLTNAGIISPNEARAKLEMGARTGLDEPRAPANIVGGSPKPAAPTEPPTDEPKALAFSGA